MGHPLNEQQRAALDRHLHSAVLANAGSGKTRILIERFLRAIVLDGVQMENIVAITFTKAAAAEMRERIHERIDELLHDPNEREPYREYIRDNELLERLRNVSRSLALSRISTFHSFCAALTRQYADVLGMPYDVRDADARESTYLVASAVSSTLREAARDDHDLHAGFTKLTEYLALDTIEKLVAGIARNRSKLRDAQKIAGTASPAILRERQLQSQKIQVALASKFLASMLTSLQGLTHVTHINNCVQSVEQLNMMLQQEGYSASVHAAMLQLKKNFLTNSLALNKTKLDKQTKSLVETQEQSDEIVGVLLTLWNEEAELKLIELTKTIASLGIRASDTYNKLKRERNVIDFDDMIHGATTLLENSEIQQAVRSGITHIMIDEFQDTDPSQFHILQLLAPDLTASAPRGPIVFVVGDDKQSIYQFRNADVRLFRTARSVITATNLRSGPDDGMRKLTQSFRMHPDLCDAVNAICSGFFVYADDAYGYDVTYEPLIAGLAQQKDPSRQRVFIVEVGSSDESVLVAQAILHALERNKDENLRPKDIAVLVPTNKLKAPVAAALRRMGIPCTIYGGRSFFSRPEVADVRNALIACIEPSNNLATASVMRSPILRCTDADIMSAAMQGRASSIQDGLAELVKSGSASDRQREALNFFQRFTQELSTSPAFEVIEQMLEHTQWHITVAGDERYEQMLGNIDKLIALCRDAVMEGGASNYEVLKAIAVPFKDDESEATILSEDDAVHIMTLHVSKGLEFKVVILAGLDGKGNSDSTIETTEMGLTIPLPSTYRPVERPTEVEPLASCLSHQCNKWIAAIRSDAEDRRLLYVALTRAKDELILCLPDDREKKRPKGLAGMLTDGLLNYDNAAVLAQSALEAVAAFTADAAAITSQDLTHSIEPLPAWSVTPSSTIEYYNESRGPGQGSSSMIGSAIHNALAELLTVSLQLTDDELMERTVRSLLTSGLSRTQASEAAIEVYTTLRSSLIRDISDALPQVRIEQQLAMMDGDVLLHGVLDVRLPIVNGVIEVWDWKTSSIRNASHISEQGALYAPQMAAYAKLCFASHPDCTTVRTRLVFTKALLKGLDPSFVVEHQRPMT